MVGIAPSDSVLGGRTLYNRHGFYALVHNSAILGLYGQDGTLNKRFVDDAFPSPLPPGCAINVKFDSSSASLMFSVDSCPFIHAEFNTAIPADVQYCPAIIFSSLGSNVTLTVDDAPPASLPCPLEVLLGTAVLA